MCSSYIVISSNYSVAEAMKIKVIILVKVRYCGD